ncbi:MAG: hypothetical protein WCQ82_06970 [Bacteroidaceae bacterium]|nr:hypothetical protein [Bacteroidaceae bacterium]
MTNLKKILAAFFLFFCVGFLFVSCDDTYKSSIPTAPVSFTCNLSQTPFYHLTATNEFLFVTKYSGGYRVQYRDEVYDANKYNIYLGYGGLVIGNSYYSGYCAFDRCCPVEYNRSTLVEFDATRDGFAVCPVCKTVYDLNNGGIPVQGVGDERLKPYSITQNGEELVIYE